MRKRGNPDSIPVSAANRPAPWIKALNENPNVIYVAEAGNLPLFMNAK